jgi:GMP synthase (glutamine-hydrolysing)
MNSFSEKKIKTNNMILILDFGSQVTQLIARRIRELGVFCEVKNFNISEDEINKINPRALILSGGPASVFEENAPMIEKNIFNLNLPIFGICYGEQLLCQLLGGKVEKSFEREFGKAEINIIADSPLLSGVINKQVWMSHGDHISKIPDGFKAIAKTPKAPFAVIANEHKKIYGAQFHPEVVHSLDGKKIIKNFVIDIAKCIDDWSMKNFKDQEIANIKKIVGQKKVICGLSGGVDSSVTASLIDQAIGSQLTCIFVDHGLLRKNEGQEVCEIFSKNFSGDFIYVDAKDLFLKNLSNISDPEQKRKIIGKTFIEVFDQQATKIKDAEFLAQGTLYPDVIESSHPNNGVSQTIKSHHNVGGLPENMQLKLLEPLRMLFKDEVRNLGRQLNLPQKLIGRHPFPGPGLAIRIIGEITQEKINILQEADNIFIEEIRLANLYDEIWQAFCVLLPIKTVGVMGDARTYENVLALRAVNSIDGMTAEVYNFDSQFLSNISNRIINEVRGINRVVYDYTSKPPGTIEWE